VAVECVVFDQAKPILELFTGSTERRSEPQGPTDLEICEAIAVDIRGPELQLVASAFELGFLPLRGGGLTPRVDKGRVGVQVHALHIAANRGMDASIGYELATVRRNVVLRKVDVHWEVSFTQHVSYESHAVVERAALRERPPFEAAIIVPHVPQVGTQCPR
jgi:hypothetical protein